MSADTSAWFFWLLFFGMLLVWILFTHLVKVDAPPDPYKETLNRCEEQHAQLMDGDERGLYGEYPPADLRGEEL